MHMYQTHSYMIFTIYIIFNTSTYHFAKQTDSIINFTTNFSKVFEYCSFLGFFGSLVQKDVGNSLYGVGHVDHTGSILLLTSERHTTLVICGELK